MVVFRKGAHVNQSFGSGHVMTSNLRVPGTRSGVEHSEPLAFLHGNMQCIDEVILAVSEGSGRMDWKIRTGSGSFWKWC